MYSIQCLKVAVLAVCLTATMTPFALAQAPAPERQKPGLKDFGSSLKRLKWDPQANAAVATKTNKTKSTTDDDVVRVETTLVVSDVVVLDKQLRVVPGLTRDDFIINEDGKPQEVGAFALGDDANIARTIVLIIDYSGSQLPFIETSVAAAKTLVDKLNPRDLMAIVTDDVELLVDFTRDKELLKSKLDTLVRKGTSQEMRHQVRFGRSLQYSALMATLNEAFDDEDQRPVIIFQTDGDELEFLRNSTAHESIPPYLPKDLHKQALKSQKIREKMYRERVKEFSLEDTYKTAEHSRATIYTVIPGFRLIGLQPDQQVERFKANRDRTIQAWEPNPKIRKIINEQFRRYPPEAEKYLIERALEVQEALAGVAKVTGGWTDFLEEPSQADGLYDRIFADMNRRYIVGYYPTNKERDGKRRKINIEVRGHPEYTIWGRKSYYAPEPD